MYINITDSEKGNNKASSGELVHYLNKENRLFPNAEKEHWFNGSALQIPAYDVKNSIVDIPIKVSPVRHCKLSPQS